MLAEIAARSGLHPVQTVSKIDFVQIELEDLWLRVQPLDPPGENQLLELPAEGLVHRQEALSRELLCDGAPALCARAEAHVGERGRDDPAEVESAMSIEALVLDREHGGDQG